MDATPLTVFPNLFETLLVFLSWSENVHLVLGLSSRIIFSQLFPLFRQFFFRPGIETLWEQLLKEFQTDHLETLHTCFTWPVDVHVVIRLSSRYFSTFYTFSTLFFQVRLVL